jgi:carboxymethylenebutenolidase
VADVERMKQALASAQGNPAAQASQLVLYPDTPHAFHADYRSSYRAGPAQDGWARAQAWFKRYL